MSKHDHISKLIPFGKLVILKSLLHKEHFLPLSISKVKLFTALPKSRTFYYSDIEGLLCLGIDISCNNYKLMIYDMNEFTIQLDVDLSDKFKMNYTNLKNNFHCLEISNGFFGFLFEEGYEYCRALYSMINKLNETTLQAAINQYNETSKLIDYSDTTPFIEQIKEDLLKELSSSSTTTTNNNSNYGSYGQSDIKLNTTSLDFFDKHFEYDDNNKQFLFCGKKEDAEMLYGNFNINKDEVNVCDSDNFHIGNNRHYVDVLVKHFIYDIKMIPIILELKFEHLEGIKKLKETENAGNNAVSTVSEKGKSPQRRFTSMGSERSSLKRNSTAFMFDNLGNKNEDDGDEGLYVERKLEPIVVKIDEQVGEESDNENVNEEVDGEDNKREGNDVEERNVDENRDDDMYSYQVKQNEEVINEAVQEEEEEENTQQHEVYQSQQEVELSYQQEYQQEYQPQQQEYIYQQGEQEQQQKGEVQQQVQEQEQQQPQQEQEQQPQQEQEPQPKVQRPPNPFGFGQRDELMKIFLRKGILKETETQNNNTSQQPQAIPTQPIINNNVNNNNDNNNQQQQPQQSLHPQLQPQPFQNKPQQLPQNKPQLPLNKPQQPPQSQPQPSQSKPQPSNQQPNQIQRKRENVMVQKEPPSKTKSPEKSVPLVLQEDQKSNLVVIQKRKPTKRSFVDNTHTQQLERQRLRATIIDTKPIAEEDEAKVESSSSSTQPPKQEEEQKQHSYQPPPQMMMMGGASNMFAELRGKIGMNRPGGGFDFSKFANKEKPAEKKEFKKEELLRPSGTKFDFSKFDKKETKTEKKEDFVDFRKLLKKRPEPNEQK